ncbi:hypothetical protein HDU96_003361 [Phlyctochytrium bullatum]|nr:hypothetical protein HDU96_003361 [Phlyctochytrium bullatum]
MFSTDDTVTIVVSTLSLVLRVLPSVLISTHHALRTLAPVTALIQHSRTKRDRGLGDHTLEDMFAQVLDDGSIVEEEALEEEEQQDQDSSYQQSTSSTWGAYRSLPTTEETPSPPNIPRRRHRRNRSGTLHLHLHLCGLIIIISQTFTQAQPWHPTKTQRPQRLPQTLLRHRRQLVRPHPLPPPYAHLVIRHIFWTGTFLGYLIVFLWTLEALHNLLFLRACHQRRHRPRPNAPTTTPTARDPDAPATLPVNDTPSRPTHLLVITDALRETLLPVFAYSERFPLLIAVGVPALTVFQSIPAILCAMALLSFGFYVGQYLFVAMKYTEMKLKERVRVEWEVPLTKEHRGGHAVWFGLTLGIGGWNWERLMP